MKYNFYKFLVHQVLLLVLPLIIFVSCTTANAKDEQLVMDENYSIGTLENGLTYYVYPTDVRPEQIMLQVTVKTGSLYETEEELGLSHFIEHLAFNSTEKYTRKEMEDLEKSLGISSSSHNNAYTSFSEINYLTEMQEPTMGRMDLLFDIMSQKTLHITFDPQEVEDERGVVLSEKQLRAANVYWDRYMFTNNTLFKDTMYPKRLPIGDEEIIKTVTPDTLRTLYEKWYRPSRMAVSVIGDVNPEEAVELIQKYFSDEEPSTPIPPTPKKISIHSKDLVKKGFYDSSQNTTTINVFYLEDYVIDDSVLILKKNLINGALYSYMSEMLEVYLQEKSFDSSILDISLYNTNRDYAYSIDAFSVDLSTESLDESIKEVQVFLSGFYQLLRTKEALLAIKEKMDERVKRASTMPPPEFYEISEYIVNHFIYGIPFIDVSASVKKYGEGIVESITHDDLNEMMDRLFKSDKNHFLLLYVGDSQKHLVDENYNIVGDIDLEHIFSLDKTDASFEFNLGSTDFTIDDLVEKPQEGNITNEEYIAEKGLYIWTLSNGNTVVFKETPIKSNKNTQIIIESKNIPTEYNFISKNQFLEDMSHYMYAYSTIKGKPLGAVLDKFTTDGSIHGGVVRVETNQKKYIEQSFQEVNLIFSQLQLTEESFQRVKYETEKNFEENVQDPQFYTLEKFWNYTRRNYKYYKERFDVNHLKNLTYKEVSDFTEAVLKSKDTMFFIVANESVDNIKPLVEKWIAPIPTKVSYPFHSEELLFPVDSVEETITRKDSEDVGYVIHASILKKDLDESIDARYGILNLVAREYMQNRVVERIREELGNSYFANVTPYVIFKPYPRMGLIVFFPTPKDAGKETLGELKKLLTSLVPVDEQELETAKKLVISDGKKSFFDRKMYIDIDLGMVQSYVVSGIEMYTQEEKDKFFTQIEAVTADEINKYITEIMSGAVISIITVPSTPNVAQESF